MRSTRFHACQQEFHSNEVDGLVVLLTSQDLEEQPWGLLTAGRTYPRVPQSGMNFPQAVGFLQQEVTMTMWLWYARQQLPLPHMSHLMDKFCLGGGRGI